MGDKLVCYQMHVLDMMMLIYLDQDRSGCLDLHLFLNLSFVVILLICLKYYLKLV